MKIKWYGQSSFLLTTQGGTRILIDPFHRLLGYHMPVVEADIVIVTHDHRDHNQLQAASGDFLLVNRPEVYNKNDVTIHGVKTYHDKQNGAKRGENIVFVIQADEMTVCHSGDLGHLLTAEQKEAIGKIDVLMVPTGGGKTINGAEAAEVMKQLQPAIAIPMHYRTKELGIAGKLLFEKVDKFIAAAQKKVTEVSELEISCTSLNEYQGIVTFRNRP
ncbi:MBL fold metallo-hydrolase [Paenibacillus sp. GCM10027626]|uniref:MBL fold metallo-hydrolase n=1 Tax=Paenibacillus sp. GCM10027626 TaxID=3273411 RepID=UPI003634C59E